MGKFKEHSGPTREPPTVDGTAMNLNIINKTKILIMKKIIPQTIILATSLFISSCSSNNDKTNEPTNTQTTENNQQQTTPVQTQEPVKPTEYNIGDTLDEGSWKFCVTKFEEGKTYNAAFYPKEGEKYVTLECYMQNTSSEKIEYWIMGWKLGSEDGYEYDLEMLGDRRPSFSSGDLEPGKKKKGYVTFKCPKEAKNFELHFNPIASLEGGSTYTIKLFK